MHGCLLTTANGGNDDKKNRRSQKRKKSRELDRVFSTFSKLPWERMKDETDAAYNAFRTYMLLGPTRSLAKLTEKLDPDFQEEYDSEVKPRYFRYAHKYKWRERAFAWDAQIDRELMIEEIESQKEMRKKHLNIAKIIQNKGIIALQNIDPNRLNPEVILKYLDAGIKIERTAMGVAESIQKHEIVNVEEHNVTVQIEPEKLTTVLEILGDIGLIPGISPAQTIDVEHRVIEHKKNQYESENPDDARACEGADAQT